MSLKGWFAEMQPTFNVAIVLEGKHMKKRQLPMFPDHHWHVLWWENWCWMLPSCLDALDAARHTNETVNFCLIFGVKGNKSESPLTLMISVIDLSLRMFSSRRVFSQRTAAKFIFSIIYIAFPTSFASTEHLIKFIMSISPVSFTSPTSFTSTSSTSHTHTSSTASTSASSTLRTSSTSASSASHKLSTSLTQSTGAQRLHISDKTPTVPFAEESLHRSY